MKLRHRLTLYLLIFGFASNTLAVFFTGSTTYNKISVVLFLLLTYQLAVARQPNLLSRLTTFGFLTLFLLNVVKNGFCTANLYDFSQIGSTALFIYTLANTKEKITTKSFAFALFFVAFALYTPVFFGVDKGRNISTPSIDENDIESERIYHSGLFETPQVAAYLFFYLTLTAYSIIKRHGITISTMPWQIAFVASISIVIFSGSRAPIYTLAISALTYTFLLSSKKLSYGLLSILTISAIYYNFDELLSGSRDTILFQYLSLIQTATLNIERLSRIMIWSIFANQVQDFSIADLLLGRGFQSSVDSIEASLGLRIWFHNDFLSVFYSYGLAGSALYLLPLIYLYKRYRDTIRANILAFTAYFSLIFFAFTNGLYYYYAPLLLLLTEFIIKQYTDPTNITSPGSTMKENGTTIAPSNQFKK